jgi:hypothetical protein
MFLIYGNRARQHTGAYVTSIPCTRCGHSTLSSFGVTRYFHLFWLPMFITSRPFGLTCGNCSHVVDKRELSEGDAQKVKATLFSPLNTLPFFTGSILIALLAVFIYWHGLEKDRIQLGYLDNPRVGDVYCADYSKLFPDADVGKFKHGAMRIASLDPDGILFAVSNEAYESKLSLFRKTTHDFPENDDYYTQQEIVIPLDSVKEMYRVGTFNEIHRFPRK